ncbi:MAG: hypothetical protein WCN98_14415 [Verrucomicrobiaceae bacterium]
MNAFFGGIVFGAILAGSVFVIFITSIRRPHPRREPVEARAFARLLLGSCHCRGKADDRCGRRTCTAPPVRIALLIPPTNYRREHQ